MSRNFFTSSKNVIYFSDHIKGKIYMAVESARVRLQLLTVSTLKSETCAFFIFAFWQYINIFGKIFIVEFVSEIRITT
jgi:hypothetical protein